MGAGAGLVHRGSRFFDVRWPLSSPSSLSGRAPIALSIMRTMGNSDVRETLFFPLLGRARAARTWPTCFKDPWSERVVALAEADRPDIQDKDMGEMPAAIYALRHLAAVTEIRRYLGDHPGAAVVDLGCGLDRLIDDVGSADGGAIVYNLDFPEVLEVRSAWMEPHEHERDLPFSLTDYRWMDEVDASDGLIAVASGVFYFLENAEVSGLVDAMARRFPGGRLVYDAESPEMVAASERAVRECGIDAAPMPFRVADPYAPSTWSEVVSDVRVAFDLSSYALDPTMLPQAVRDGFAAMRQGEALYEVVVDFAQPDPAG